MTQALQRSQRVATVRGEGLLLGVVLRHPHAKAVEQVCREEGLLVNAIGDDVIRMAPALNLTAEQADTAVSILGEALG